MSHALTDAPLLTDSVYHRLIEEIVDGKLPPGQRIRQAALAERLGVSRAPVSHALQLLKQRGLVREAGKMGVEVAPVSADRVRDLYQIRARLDGLAARLAAARVKVGELPTADLERFRRVFDAGAIATSSTSMSQQVRADVAFHREIYDICGNSSIAATMDPLWLHIQRAMVLVLEAGLERQRAWGEHRVIMGAILGGQPEEAEELAFLHAANAGSFTENRLRGTR
ncbi:GntR family transcriptional regulator [Bradyrhizobium sp. WSM 4400]|nr:GntR family transcriptional regulator [Bradyrhizobium australafricanum]